MSEPTYTGDVDAAREVERIDRAWIDAFNREDVDTLVGLYAEDVVVMPPDHPDVHGRDAVAAWMRRTFESVAIRQELTNTEVHAGADWAVMRGRFTLWITPRDGGETAEVRGKHLVVWRRDPGGGWTAWRDLWNLAPGPG